MHLFVENCPDYLIGSAFFVLVWLVLYWLNPESRLAMRWAGTVMLPFGPLLESAYIIDYWHPEHWFYLQWGWLRLSLEDLIFTFTCIGICTCFFDVVQRRHSKRPILMVSWQSLTRLFSSGAICLGTIGLIWWLGWWHGHTALHSVNAHVLGCLIAFPIVVVQRGWRLAALVASAGGAAFMVIFYALYYTRLYPDIFERWWNLKILSQIRPLGIPIEEIYWMAATVLFIGPMVRFCLVHTPEGNWRIPHKYRQWRDERGAKKR